MTKWQRRARLVIAVAAVAFAIVVGFALKRRAPQPAVPSAAPHRSGSRRRGDGRTIERFKLSREDVRVAYERQLTYADGSTRLMGVTISADERAGGRSFTVTGKEATVGQNESTIHAERQRAARRIGRHGRADRARDLLRQGRARSRGRAGGVFTRPDDRVGRRHDLRHGARRPRAPRSRDRARRPGRAGRGATEIASGTATFARREKNVRFERDVKLQREQPGNRGRYRGRASHRGREADRAVGAARPLAYQDGQGRCRRPAGTGRRATWI